MSAQYAISDIHGCCRTFIALVENVVQLKKEDTLYLLGDYIDRGPDSKGVIDYILQLRETGFKVITLRGNHEDMLLRGLKDTSYLHVFLRNGGDKTLQSFGVDRPEDIPSRYIDFLASTSFYATHGRYVLVHAGINGEAEDPFEDREAMLWSRSFKVTGKIKDCVVVHGHTPTPTMEIQDMVLRADLDRNIDIDNGCVYGLNEFYGNLACLNLDTLELFFQPNIDQKPLF